MVASVSNSNSAISSWADSMYSKLDTKNQGYIEKSDLQSALSAAGDGSKGKSVNIDETFSALDGDSDGKVTKSELTEAMTKLSDRLGAQFDASRVGRGGHHPDGSSPPGDGSSTRSSSDAGGSGTGAMGGIGGSGTASGPHGAHGSRGGRGDGDGSSAPGRISNTNGTGSTSTDYIAAADTDGDGTVSDTEEAAYEKNRANGDSDGGSTSVPGKLSHRNDPMRELAHALHLLKQYSDMDANSDTSARSPSTDKDSSINIEA